MTRKRWILSIVVKSLVFRRWRSLLLVAVLALASGLLTALGIVSVSMQKRVEEEVRKYGANLVILPQAERLSIGAGHLSFGPVATAAYLQESAVRAVLSRQGRDVAGFSRHLRAPVVLNGQDITAEGVDFAEIRQLLPWWQLKGSWPRPGEVLLGVDLAEKLSLQVGSEVTVAGRVGGITARIAGLVATGGDEDKVLFAHLPELQAVLDLEGKLSQVRILAPGAALAKVAADLRTALPAEQVREVRQTSTTSEALLKKVQLLMVLVTSIVIVTSWGSVAATMGTTVLERTKEIGLLKAMGGKRGEVLFLFAAEALATGTAGGVAGYLAGSGIATLVTRTVFAARAELLPWVAPLAVGSGLLLALAGSLGPMIAVYRLDPVQSLRGE